jgi:hypothetical protein
MKTSFQKLNYEDYTYNKYESNIDLDIDTLVVDLLKCGRDRQKFNEIMKSLDSEFLGNEQNAVINEDKIIENNKNNRTMTELNHENYGMKNNIINPKNIMTLTKTMNNINNINYNHVYDINDMHTSKQNLSALSFTDRIERSNRFDNSDYVGGKYNKSPGKNIHKKYTDVHANTKFYYPTQYSSYEDDDLNFEPSQWTNRANRTMYTSIYLD